MKCFFPVGLMQYGLVLMSFLMTSQVWAQAMSDQRAPRLDDQLMALDELLNQQRGDQANASAVEYQWRFSGGLKLRDTTLRRIPQGIEPVDLTMQVVRIADKWHAPKWSVASRRLSERLDVEQIDLAGIERGDHQLSGQMKFIAGRRSTVHEMGRGENAHSMMKAARRSVLGWNIGGMQRVNPYEQKFDIQIEHVADAYMVTLKLTGAVGKHKHAKAPKSNENQAVSWDQLSAFRGIARKDVLVEMVYVDGAWKIMNIEAAGFNKGDHQLNATDLRIDEDGLQGAFEIKYGSDRWVSGGVVRYQLQLNQNKGKISGTFNASGAFGEYSGALSGSQWHLLQGRYETRGLDGEWGGKIFGGWRAIEVGTVTDADESSNLNKKLTAINARMMQLRAFPFHADGVEEVGFEQLAIDKPEDQTLKLIASYVQANMSLVKNTETVIHGNHQTVDVTFGPYGLQGVNETENTKADSEWRLTNQWHVIGPFVKQGHAGAGHRILPAVFPSPESVYQDYRLILDQQEAITLKWHEKTVENGIMKPDRGDWSNVWVHHGKMSSYKKHPLQKAYRAREAGQRHFEWYAEQSFRIVNPKKVWVAIQAVDYGQLWVNGTLIWESGDKYDSSQPAIFQVQLKAGHNQFLVRSGKKRITYFPPKEDARSWFRMWINETTQPREPAQIIADDQAMERLYETAATEAATWRVWDREAKSSNAPVAWNAKGNVNIQWRKRFEGVTQLHPWNDQLLMVMGNKVISVNAASGEMNWEYNSDSEVAGRSWLSVLGNRAFVYIAGGRLIALDENGEVIWGVEVQGAGLPGKYAGPLVHDDFVFLLQSEGGNKGEARAYQVQAFHRENGRFVWGSDQYAGNARALVNMKLPNRDKLHSVLITSDGRVFDAVDGSILAEDLFNTGPAMNGTELPLVDRDRLFITTTRGQMGLKLWIDDQGRLNSTKLWEFLRSGRPGSHAVITQGRIYVPRIADEYHPHHPVCWEQLDVYALDGGHHLAKRKPVVLDAVSPGALIASKDYLVYSSTGHAPGHYPGVKKPRAQLVILTQDETPLVLSRMSFVQKMSADPVIADGRLFVGIGKEVWCIGHTDEKGKKLESLTKAKSILTEVGKRLIARDQINIPSMDSSVQTIVSEPELVRDGIPFVNWQLAGPVERASLAPYSTELTRDHGAILTDNILAKSFKPMDSTLLFMSGQRQIFEGTRRIFVDMHSINLSGMFKGKRNSGAVLYNELLITEKTTYQVTQKKSSMSTIYLGGKVVKPEDVITLVPGRYAMAIELKVSRLPRMGKVSLSLSLVETSDPQLAMNAYLDRVGLYQSALEDIVKELPGTAEALLASNHLKMLSE